MSEHHAASSHHILPVRVYIAIFLALMVLTVITVFVAFLDLGRLNDVVAMAVAVTKASLVILYFMHVRYSDGLTAFWVIGGFAFLAILIIFTMSDYLTRAFLATFAL